MITSGKSTATLAVVIMVPEANDALSRTLDSVSTLADEILVADIGWMGTAERNLAENRAQVLAVDWEDDLSAVRNRCLAELTCDWVLWLESGEEIRPEDGAELLHFLGNQADLGEAYLAFVKSRPTSTSTSIEQVHQIRLTPRHGNVRFQGRVRESAVDSLSKAGISLASATWSIYRGFDNDNVARHEAKARFELRLADRELAERGAIPQLLNCKGRALLLLGRTKEAEACFRQCLGLATPRSPELLECYYGLLATLDEQLEHPASQVEICLQALDSFPLDSQLLCSLGRYQQAQGQWELACRSYRMAYQRGTVSLSIWHWDDILEIAAVGYSRALQFQNNVFLAEKSLHEALQMYPKSQRIRRQLLEVYILLGRINDAMEIASSIDFADSQRETMRTVIRGACMASQRHWPTARCYLQAAHAAGCRNEILLRWYAITLLCGGEVRLAEEILTAWRFRHDRSHESMQLCTEHLLNSRRNDTLSQPTDPDPRKPLATSNLADANRLFAEHMFDQSVMPPLGV